jgi:hypothetical protein
MRDHLTIRQIEHREYLKSPLWKSIRANAIEHYGEVCGKCGDYGNDVHHITYDRVGGQELLDDLQVLCRDCHEALHAIEKKSKQHKGGKRSCTLIGLYSSLSKKQKIKIEEKYGVNAYAILTSPSDAGHEAREMAMRMAEVHIIDDNYMLSCKISFPNKTSAEFIKQMKIAKQQGKDIKKFRKEYFSC